jgi:predicted enzyme related to lactoylglutathione lyase
MPEVTEHAPGTLSWTDLASEDLDASAAFYGGLFGWESRQAPGDPEETRDYRFFSLRGKSVAGYGHPGPGEPPSWRVYFAAAAADEVAAKVRGADGQVLLDPFDVMDAGRLAVFSDPAGAVFCCWQPKQHPGTELVGEPGGLAWSELSTGDKESAKSFYGEVFGWEAEEQGEYTQWNLDGQPVGGMIEAVGDVPPHWLVYFAADDVDAAVESTKELGGSVAVEPRDFPGGRFAVVADPHGAHFGLLRLTSAGPPNGG